MKKLASIFCAVFGVILAMVSISMRKESASIGIIGGADGPTAVFVAGKIGTAPVIGLAAIGVCLILAAVWVIKKKRS